MASVKQPIAYLALTAAWAVCGSSGCNLHSPLADRQVVLPENVQLPKGFYPLTGQYNPDDPQDSYDGWPRYIVCERDDMVMAYVPSRSFRMGGGIDGDEGPQRQVKVNHFYIDLHEVTNVQYDRFRKAADSKCRLNHYRTKDRPWVEAQSGHTYKYEYAPRCFGKQKLYPEPVENFWLWSGQTPGDIDFYLDYWTPGLNNAHPVRAVSWWEAWYYSKWTGKALPTEAQWEAAARGGDQRAYPWGNEEELEHSRYLCNCRTGRDNFDGYEYTAPVLSYAAGISPYGVYNMAGNVWEWCADYYDPGRYAYPSGEDPPSALERGAKSFGDRHYPNPLDKDLREGRVGPLCGDARVVRGGSFADPIERCRVDARMAARPDVHQNNFGFRCVLPLPAVVWSEGG